MFCQYQDSLSFGEGWGEVKSSGSVSRDPEGTKIPLSPLRGQLPLTGGAYVEEKLTIYIQVHYL